MEHTLSKRALNRATLARQMLLAREKAKPVAVVEQLAGMQAQVPKPPFIGLWSRIENFKRDDMKRAVDKRELVRATMMRGTLHLMSRRDYLAMRAPLQSMLTRGMSAVLRNRADFDLDVIMRDARRFFGDQPRTFDELRRHLIQLHPKFDERAMGYGIRMHLPLIQVPDESTWSWPANASFALTESWLGEPIANDVKPHALALRYLAAFGPASVADFQSWSGLSSMRGTIDELRPKLVTFRDERGRELFDLPKAPRPDESTEAPVRFLPDYDNLLLGHDDRSRVIADEHRKRIITPNLRILASFLVDGVVSGGWTVERKKKSATMKIEPFVKLIKKVRDQLAAEGEALLRFAESDAETLSIAFAT
jgi:hypothetical protein